jgi:hypothetical protein
VSKDVPAGYAAALEADAGFQRAMASAERRRLDGDRGLRAAAMRVLWERIRGIWARRAVAVPGETPIRLAAR